MRKWLNENLPAFESVVWPAALLTSGLWLLQTHAIPYWQARAGTFNGILWSLLLEAIAFFLLYQTDPRLRAAGKVVAFLLVCVPLWQLAHEPLERFDAAQRQAIATTATLEEKAGGQARSTWEAQVRRLEQSAQGYRDQLQPLNASLASAANADPKYVQRLDANRARIQARLDKAELELNAKQEAPPAAAKVAGAGAGWLAWLRVILDILPGAASLVLFQSANVLAIGTIRRFRHGAQAATVPPKPPPPPRGKPEPEKDETADFKPVSTPPAPEVVPPLAEMKPAPETPVSTETPLQQVAVPRGTAAVVDEVTIHRLQRVLSELVRKKGTAAKWCEQEIPKVNPRDLSFVMNHFGRIKEGKETISAPKLAELVARYLPAAKEGTGA